MVGQLLVNKPCSPRRCKFTPGRPRKVKPNAIAVPKSATTYTARTRWAGTGRPEDPALGICPTGSLGARGAPRFAAAQRPGRDRPAIPERRFRSLVVLCVRLAPCTRALSAPCLASVGIAIFPTPPPRADAAGAPALCSNLEGPNAELCKPRRAPPLPDLQNTKQNNTIINK